MAAVLAYATLNGILTVQFLATHWVQIALSMLGWVTYPEMVLALPDKQCLSDLMPTHVLKLSVDTWRRS